MTEVYILKTDQRGRKKRVLAGEIDCHRPAPQVVRVDDSQTLRRASPQERVESQKTVLRIVRRAPPSTYDEDPAVTAAEMLKLRRAAAAAPPATHHARAMNVFGIAMGR